MSKKRDQDYVKTCALCEYANILKGGNGILCKEKGKKQAISIVDENVNKGHSFIVEVQIGQSFWKAVWQYLSKFNTCIPFDPAVLLLEIKRVIQV